MIDHRRAFLHLLTYLNHQDRLHLFALVRGQCLCLHHLLGLVPSLLVLLDFHFHHFLGFLLDLPAQHLLVGRCHFDLDLLPVGRQILDLLLPVLLLSLIHI